LLEALQQQLVLLGVGGEPDDHVIEIVVLDLEGVKAAPDVRLFLFGQGEVGHLWKRSCPMAASYPYTWRGETPAPMQRNDYDVTDSICTTDPLAVGGEVIRLYCKLFPHASPRALERAFVDLARMYDGGDLTYW